MDTFQVLFVCTGNICRSPMAEGILKDLLIDEAASGSNLRIEAASAGTHAFDGNAPSEYAVQVAAQHGIDIGYYRSSHLSEDIVHTADLILTMEKNHTNLIQGFWPSVKCVFELKKFGYEKNTSLPLYADILDPIGLEIGVYLSVFNELTQEITRVFPEILSYMEKK